MLLSIAAALFHGLGFTIYILQVYQGGSVPNPASWTVWALLAVLNALTFWKASKDTLATAQFFTGSVACLTVWIFSLIWGKFSSLTVMDWAVLASCAVVGAVWWTTKKAVYANLVAAGILLASSLPTIAGVWHDSSLERPLPWVLWTTAYITTSANVFRRRDRNNHSWWLLMVLPVVGIIVHGIVVLIAKW